MRMTPFSIEIVLHYYYSPEEHRGSHAPIWGGTIQFLLDEGLLAKRAELSEYGASYEATEKGRAYVEALCAMPFPVQKWVMPKEG
jgi:hypothetical protein